MWLLKKCIEGILVTVLCVKLEYQYIIYLQIILFCDNVPYFITVNLTHYKPSPSTIYSLMPRPFLITNITCCNKSLRISPPMYCISLSKNAYKQIEAQGLYSEAYGILLCLMPDNFIRQEESAATQWVNMIGYNLCQIYVLDG